MLKGFSDWLMEKGRADGTQESYALNVELYMRWYRDSFGSDMTELLHSNILDYRSYLQNIERQKAVTINAKLSALVSFDAFLIETGRQKVSAVSKKDLLKIQATYTRLGDVTEKQVEAFRQQILIESSKRDYALVTILAYAGLRISEALALRPEEVDMVGRQITVSMGKGNKERVVFIGDKIINAVREYLKELDPDSELLFPGRAGEKLDRSVANKLCRRFSDSITPHSLRHFFCTNALEKGYSFHEVANQAGHSNIHTTLRYASPTSAAMKEKANKL